MNASAPNIAVRSAARILVDQLLIHGVERAYCVPGESYLAVLDALSDVKDRIELIVCRQEGGAGNMAEAYGKMTGRPGVCMVTRGPGATNAAIAIHTAQQDSTPMVVFIGQVGTDCVGREAFQEIDYRRMFGSIAKWVGSIDRADRTAEIVGYAFQVAASGRPGPVVVALPEDVLLESVRCADARRYQPALALPASEQLDAVVQMMNAASRPFVILGGRGWDTASRAAFAQFAEAAGLPVGCVFRTQDVFPNDSPSYVGDVGIGINPKLAARIKASDLVLAIGPLLGEITTSGYTLFDHPVPAQRLVHVHAGAESLGRVFQADLMINSAPAAFARALAAHRIDGSKWAVATREARADYEQWQQPRVLPGGLQMGQVAKWLGQRVPADTILTNGAGNFATPFHRFYRYRGFPSQLGPTSGAMGYAIPAAIAAKLQHRDRLVIAATGDGDFMMTGQELATSIQYDAPIIVLLVNNGMYGTIRMHQEREFPGRVYATALRNPDFVALGKAYGLHAERVTETAAFEPAFERAIASPTGALLELMVDAQAITPGMTLDEIRAQALRSKA